MAKTDFTPATPEEVAVNYRRIGAISLSASSRHQIVGVMEPLYFRRIGATGLSALRRHFANSDQRLELSLNG